MEIAIKWSYSPRQGVTLMDIVKWDDYYGLNNRSSFLFGIEINGELIAGQEAYDYIVNNDLLDSFPTFYLPQRGIPNPEWQPESGLPQTIPNPNYQAELEAWNAAKQTMLDIMHNMLKLTCKVTFPYVQDVGNGIKWYKKNIFWRSIPVEVGKYPLRHTRVIVRNEPEHPQYKGYLSYITTCGTDKDKMLRILLGLLIPEYNLSNNVTVEPEPTIG